jgi:hypothetical protein
MPRGDVPWYILRIHIAPGATSYVNTAANAREREVLREMSNALLKMGTRRESLPLEIFVSSVPEQ